MRRLEYLNRMIKYASLRNDLKTVKKLAKLWEKTIAVKRPAMFNEQQKGQYG